MTTTPSLQDDVNNNNSYYTNSLNLIQHTEKAITTILNEINNQNIIKFSPSDLKFCNYCYIYLIRFLNQNSLFYFQYLLTHKPNNLNLINKDKLLKSILFIITHHSINTPTTKQSFNFYSNINNIVIRMFLNKYIQITDIKLIIHFYFILSCLNLNKKQTNFTFKHYYIQNFDFIEIAFQLTINTFITYNNKEELSIDEKQLIASILLFFENKFINENYTNIFSLTTPSFTNKFNVFSLLQFFIKTSYINQDQKDIVYTQLKHLFMSIFKCRFNYATFMKPILNIFKDILINFDKQNILTIKYNFQRLNFILQYFHDVFFEEKKYIKNNYISNMFYFGKKDAGLVFTVNKIKADKINVIFSFKLIPLTNKNRYTLIGFHNENNNLLFYLEKEKDETKDKTNIYNLKIKSERTKNENIIDTNIQITENKTYVFVLSIGNKQIEIKNSEGNKFSNTSSIGFNFSVGSTILVGNNSIKNEKDENTFNGFIGPIIGLKDISKEYIDKILQLKNDYEYIIYNSSSFIIDDEILKQNALLYNDNNINIKEHIVFIISTNTYQLKPTKNGYSNISNKENNNVAYETPTQENSNKMVLENLFVNNENQKSLSDFDQKFFIFKLNKTFPEFLNCNGLKFIALVFEYYYQIINLFQTRKKEDITFIIKLL